MLALFESMQLNSIIACLRSRVKLQPICADFTGNTRLAMYYVKPHGWQQHGEADKFKCLAFLGHI